MNKKQITKAQLVTILHRWQANEITTETMQIWMLDNFEPDEFEIGVGERPEVIEAMHIVMNEYELADAEKCLTDRADLALTFLDCLPDDFEQRKGQFLREGFCD